MLKRIGFIVMLSTIFLCHSVHAEPESPNIERKDIKPIKIDTENFEIGLQFGNKTIT